MRSLESQTLKLLELITTNEKVRSLESQKSLELITITEKVRNLESQTPLENIMIYNKVRNVVTKVLQCLVRNARMCRNKH